MWNLFYMSCVCHHATMLAQARFCRLRPSLNDGKQWNNCLQKKCTEAQNCPKRLVSSHISLLLIKSKLILHNAFSLSSSGQWLTLIRFNFKSVRPAVSQFWWPTWMFATLHYIAFAFALAALSFGACINIPLVKSLSSFSKLQKCTLHLSFNILQHSAGLVRVLSFCDGVQIFMNFKKNATCLLFLLSTSKLSLPRTNYEHMRNDTVFETWKHFVIFSILCLTYRTHLCCDTQKSSTKQLAALHHPLVSCQPQWNSPFLRTLAAFLQRCILTRQNQNTYALIEAPEPSPQIASLDVAWKSMTALCHSVQASGHLPLTNCAEAVLAI